MSAKQDFFTHISRYRLYTPEEVELIGRAYDLAFERHQGQKRKSGEPYFVHPVAVAEIVASWGIDAETIAAALVHDVLEDTGLPATRMMELLGSDVTFLVEGVTKVGHLKYRGNQAQVETLKKMILAISEDIRVVFIKLADRTHNMRTLQHLPPDKQQRIALETTEIFAPLAYRLGLGAVAGELEDLAFPYLYPEEYAFLMRELAEHFKSGEAYVARVKEEIARMLAAQPHIHVVKIDARAKRINSLYKKLRRKDMNLEEIYDLIALRVIVETVEDCYAVLGTIHAAWPPLPGTIKDYIALPKPNGYQSLHTTVICLDSRPTEIQIRTEEMHVQAEYGISAHWAYQEAKSGKKYLEERGKITADARQLEWVNQLKAWQQQSDSQEDFLQSVKVDFFKDRIFVITPKGEVIDLPACATPIDFAYSIHGDIGNRCAGARVNGKMVALNYELQSGDLVQIVTQKNKIPSESWLTFAKTARARERIRGTLRKEGVIETPKYYEFLLTAEERIGLLSDVSRLFSRERVSIAGHESPRSRNKGAVFMKIVTGPEGKEKSAKLLVRLRQLEGVKEVKFQESA